MFDNDIFLNGDRIVHQVRIENGRAYLKTRYVQTDKLKAERAAGRALFGQYRNPFSDHESVANVDRGTANTSVMWHGGKLLALKEAARPVELDPETLETIGTYDFGGALGDYLPLDRHIATWTRRYLPWRYSSGSRIASKATRRTRPITTK